MRENVMGQTAIGKARSVQVPYAFCSVRASDQPGAGSYATGTKAR